jgi:glycosyltransferase 2 family protein
VKLRFAIVAVLGLGLVLYLALHLGIGAVLSAAGAVGWGGFALLCAYVLALCVLLAAAWYVLLPHSAHVRFAPFAWARMVREAAGDVLPFSQIGGLLIGARAATHHQVPSSWAFASTIADVTTELVSQIAYIALGLGILTLRAPPTALTAALIRYFEIGLGLAVLASVSLLALQRYRHALTFRLAERLLPRARAHTDALAAALDAIYASRVRVALSAATHLLAWIAGALGSWIALRLMRVHIDPGSVIALESLVCAVRSAAVLVPGGLGVQEAAYALLVPLFGVAAPLGLALSLVKRARDIAVGVPILLLSQAIEGRRALALKESE